MNYFGTAYCRKKRHLTLDDAEDSLTDQLWDRRVKLKRLYSHSLFNNNISFIQKSDKSPINPVNNSFFYLNSASSSSEAISESEYFDKSSSGIVADLFNSIAKLDSELENISNDPDHSFQNSEPENIIDTYQNQLVPSSKLVVDNFEVSRCLLNNSTLNELVTKRSRILSYLSNRFIVRPTIPNFLPPPISNNLLLFQDLLKNSKGPPISVVNIVDDAPPPLDFEFINESRYASDVPRPQQLQVNSCSCETEEIYNILLENNGDKQGSSSTGTQVKTNNSSSIFSGYSSDQYKMILRTGCKHNLAKDGEITSNCIHNPETGGPYNSSGLLQLPEKHAIYECNWMCPCGPNCLNRLIQRGPTILFQVFRTAKKGWGVRTLETLQKGQFVAEYVGEVITYAEAESRGKKNDKLGSTYLFDLDFETPEDMDPEFTIDAEKCGNVAHFLNHSCDPNLQIRAAYINHCDSRLHQLAFFTKNRIPAGTELTFDYNPSAPFPGDRGYVDFSEHKGRNIEYQSFRSPNRSSRPGISASNAATNPQQNLQATEPQADQNNSGYLSDDYQPANGSIGTPKKRRTSVAPYIHKGYVCHCGAVRCRGFVFLS
ncbi:Histone-lysine N-methyltransferase SUV39H2 [Smittium culicis]|uniref:Histone-lysine N-methyltransferase SUV39H2 n=1 Tax=Smittium culicis TaxID=133412 RepID=A0A1R1YDD3_9FUNG|nr:Histone-lysine N-methyltransferase SUV39H2 [Smittium culicis]